MLVLAGLACLGYVGYQIWGTNIGAHRAYDSERARIKQSWNSSTGPGETSAPDGTASAGHGTLVPGDAIGLISIPAIGVDQVPILQGVGLGVLARGVGHYPGTAGPGAVGNFAVAGHRITHGEPFANLLKMQPGDKIIVQTRTTVFTYQLDQAPRSLTVEETAGWVIDPVPGHPNQRPTRKLITLTTCQDLFHSPDRSVGFGHLVSTRTK
ncbi:class E sortase [Microlunatus endophyticus]|uniref:Class E sortase n=1 Tax=Microlunatus endophyticus TaxID=1716077 RepID=A0A917W8E7_9ACTN|nr:class E sortase [Microlunatus endophyticus]GGL76725.1 class E sortase [Microlunatus endophyticus]